jgi:hypothetical protein
VGSRSLGNTVLNLFWFPFPGLAGAGLAFFWLSSPLAGQAALRVVEPSFLNGLMVESYWNVSNITEAPALNPQSGCSLTIEQTISSDLFKNYVSAMSYGLNSFSGGNISTEKQNLRDQNGNPLLPMEGEVLDSGFEVQQMNVSSFVGPQILGSSLFSVPGVYFGQDIAIQTANITFPVSLFEVNCTHLAKLPMDSNWTSYLGQDSMYANLSESSAINDTKSGFFLDTAARVNNSQQEPRTIIFGSFYNSDVMLWTCSLGLLTRDLTTQCNDELPQVPFMCEFDSMGEPSRSIDTPLDDDEITKTMFEIWPLVDKSSSEGSSVTEKFLAKGVYDLDLWLADLSTVDNITFSTRLTTAFNTFWMLARETDDMGGDVYDRGLFEACGVNYIRTTASTPLSLYPLPILVCNWFWFTVLAVTSTVLLICAIMNIWFFYNINTPDILGYVSSMAIENPHVPIPGEHPGARSVLSGLERSKWLGNVRVRIGDVRSNEEVGKIAFAADGNGVAPVEKGRMVI